MEGIDRAIWAIWYDLAAEGREEYLDWLHEVHMPEILSRSGYLWAAHFRVTGGGERFQSRVVRHLTHAQDPSLGRGKGYVLLCGAPSTRPFFDPDPATRERRQRAEWREMTGRRRGVYSCIFAEEARVEGPDAARRAPGLSPGPAVQIGTFNAVGPENEDDLGAWYAQYRLPSMAQMPGCVGARKLLASAGWGKHGVLYEFVSLEARERSFIPHEELAHDEREWTGRIVRNLVHAPVSPSVGERIWPPPPS